MANTEIRAALVALIEDLEEMVVPRIPSGSHLLTVNVSMEYNLKTTGQDDEIYNTRVIGMGKNYLGSQNRFEKILKQTSKQTPPLANHILMSHTDDS